MNEQADIDYMKAKSPKAAELMEDALLIYRESRSARKITILQPEQFDQLLKERFES